jgi:hypothetical protein
MLNFGKAMRHRGNRSGTGSRYPEQAVQNAGTYALVRNQTTISTATMTIAPQTAGITILLLPLRGEQFGAWL